MSVHTDGNAIAASIAKCFAVIALPAEGSAIIDSLAAGYPLGAPPSRVLLCPKEIQPLFCQQQVLPSWVHAHGVLPSWIRRPQFLPSRFQQQIALSSWTLQVAGSAIIALADRFATIVLKSRLCHHCFNIRHYHGGLARRMLAVMASFRQQKVLPPWLHEQQKVCHYSCTSSRLCHRGFTSTRFSIVLCQHRAEHSRRALTLVNANLIVWLQTGEFS